jgi:hypothetical protein
MLTEALVTKPANTSAKPNARTIGHGDGAGSSIMRGIRSVPVRSSSVSDAIF